MRNFIILLSMIASLTGMAETYELLTVTSSEDSDYSKLILETDDSSGEVINLLVKAFNKKNVMIDDREFSYDEINDQGAVLSESDGHEVVVIKKINVNQESGGQVSLDLLSNALTGQRMDFELKLLKTSDSWQVIDVSANKSITSMHFEARKFLGKAVGIKKVKTE